MFKIILLLLVTLKDCDSLGYSPVNTATVAGKPMLMMCGLNPNNTTYRSTVEWKFQSVGNTQTELMFNGYRIPNRESGLFIINATEGEFNLAKNRSQLRDAGAYHCIKRIQDQQSLRTEINIAQLTILESEPVCGSNASNGSVVEGDHLRMWCSVNYSGNLDPVMEWSKNDGSIVDSTVSYSNDTFQSNVTSESHQTINFNEHGIVYFCKTYFKAQNSDSWKEGSSSATNAPDYKDVCKLTVNVSFGPRNLSISPIKSTYYNGELLHCSAVGNPTPSYEWIDVHDTGYVVSGPVLILNERMEQGKAYTFQCTVENVVSGEKKTASEYITIHIAGIDLMYIAIMMAIIFAMLLIIAICLGREHIKGCVAHRISALRRRSGTEPDVLPNADGDTSTCNYELEPSGQFTMPAETEALGVASINLEQRVGPEEEAKVPVYAEVNKTYKPESDCPAETTKNQASTKLSIGLDGTVYSELKADEGRSQASGTLFKIPMFNKSEYAGIDHTIEPPLPPER